MSTSLSAPCPLKDHVALASLSFINGMSVPSCVVALGEGMVHLRRGLRPLIGKECYVGSGMSVRGEIYVLGSQVSQN